jgi:hypothetical protein
LDLLIAAAVAAESPAGALAIFGFNFSVFCNYVIDIFFGNGSVRTVPFTDSSLMWFSSAILRASGDTFIFRISAVLQAYVLIVFPGWLQWDSFFFLFWYLKKRRSAVPWYFVSFLNEEFINAFIEYLNFDKSFCVSTSIISPRFLRVAWLFFPINVPSSMSAPN